LAADVREEREVWLAELDATVAGLTAQDAGEADVAACQFARADCFLRLRLSLLRHHG
jgi:ethanolamine utilization microcompartment shell protein EutL